MRLVGSLLQQGLVVGKMSYQPFLKNSNSQQQIVIHEASSQDFSDPEEPIEEIVNHNHQHQQGRCVEELKINRQKLFKYSNITPNNHILQPLNNKSQTSANPSNKIERQNTPLNNNPSLKTLKYIKHKITQSNTRLKTQEDKENDYKHILPKMNAKDNKTMNMLNKTTSVLALKENNCQTNTQNIKQNEFRKINGVKVGVKSTRLFDKNSTSKMKLNESQSKQSMNKSFNKSYSLSKFRYVSNNDSSNQLSIDHTEIMSALGHINEKQEQLTQQKIQLQHKAKELRDNIQKEHHLIEEITRNKEKINYSMTRQEHLSRYSLDGAKMYKKKLQNCQHDAKTLEYKLTEVAQENNKLSQAINQEKELISMYQSVIEELKGQLKIEKQTKIDLQKKVTILKKTLKSAESKANSQQSNTRQIFHKIFVSLQRWQ